jgi:putative membrane protein
MMPQNDMDSSRERNEWLRRKPNHALAKLLKISSWAITGLVLVIVGMMRQPDLRIPLPDGVDLSFLPAVYSSINGMVAILLIAAVIAVKSGKIRLHRNLMLTAMGLSVLFLLGYVAYHFTNIEILFGDIDHDGIISPAESAEVGTTRPVYLVLLITHIIAAGVSLPLILLTFSAAWTNRFAAHRKLAHWVFPVWLYVAVTGPICYLMLRPYYI